MKRRSGKVDVGDDYLVVASDGGAVAAPGVVASADGDSDTHLQVTQLPVLTEDADGDLVEEKPIPEGRRENEDDEDWVSRMPETIAAVPTGTVLDLYKGSIQLAKERKMSTGERVDYILVHPTPRDELALKLLSDGILTDEVHGRQHDTQIKRAIKRVRFENKLVEEGCVLEREISDGEIVFVRIHVPFEVMAKEAENIRLKKRLMAQFDPFNDPENILDNMREFFMRQTRWFDFLLRWRWPDVQEEDDFYSAKFRLKRIDQFENSEDTLRFFTDGERSLLTHHILRRTPYGGPGRDDQLGIEKMINNGSYTDAFPLHDAAHKDPTWDEIPENPVSDRQKLYRWWGRFAVWYMNQPLDLVYRYYGAKVAIYFAWLGHYTKWLWFPGIFGVLVFIFGLARFQTQTDSEEICSSKKVMCSLCDTCDKWVLNVVCDSYKISYIFDNEATLVFAFFMSIWASAYTDGWRRYNSLLAYDWDVMDFEEEEPDRPQFKGPFLKENPVTGKMEPSYPAYRRGMKYLVTGLTLFSFLTLVIIVLVAVIVYRLAVSVALFDGSEEGSYIQENATAVTSVTAAILNLISIILLNKIYGKVAVVLTEWENHRKESRYQSQLAFKIFLFQFVNSYSSLFYIAFFKGKFTGKPGDYNTFMGFRQDECPPYGCLLELTIQLIVIMIGKQTMNNFQEVVIPAISAWRFRRSKRGQALGRDNILPWERELLKNVTYPKMGLFYEYLEMVIQFGFITLFVAAFPLGPFFALTNNILEIRVDARKHVKSFRRPPWFLAEDIGVWQRIMETISWVSVITNGLVIAFTSNIIVKLVWRHKTGSLVGFADRITPYTPLEDVLGADPRQVNCSYTSLREPITGENGTFFYEVTAAKLAFVIVFEHVVFFSKYIMQEMIPDMPKGVRISIMKEDYLAKMLLDEHIGTVDHTTTPSDFGQPETDAFA